MTTNGTAGRQRPGSLEELRGYLAAAGDLSAIARARLLEAARSAARAEIERAGGALGLAGAGEVARLRRTVERLERRVATLEAGGARSTSRPASRGTGRPAPLPRSARRPASRLPGGPADPAGPAVPPPPAVPGAPGAPGAPASSAPGPASPPVTRSASGRAPAAGTVRPPVVRRPAPPEDQG